MWTHHIVMHFDIIKDLTKWTSFRVIYHATIYTCINIKIQIKSNHNNDTWWQLGDEENPLRLDKDDTNK